MPIRQKTVDMKVIRWSGLKYQDVMVKGCQDYRQNKSSSKPTDDG